MSDLSNFPYMAVEFGKDGSLNDADDIARATDFVAQNGVTDLFVVSHGWNNDMADARRLYEDLFRSTRSVLDGGSVALPGRTLGVLGVLWPSKKFTERALMPGGAASVGGTEEIEAVEELLDELDATLGTPSATAEIAAIKAVVSDLENDPDARETFANKVRDLVPKSAETEDDGSDGFFAASAEELFTSLEAPILFLPAPGGGGGAAGGAGGSGGAAGLGDLVSGPVAAARRLLNMTTYYTMKARAGDVGANGVRRVVSSLREADPQLKVHLVGHSFGGRVVTAAARALGNVASDKASSMALLQAAFSHNGFAQDYVPGKNGFFRSVMSSSKVTGPVLVTHTHNDKANATAYPMASRLAGQNAAALGGPGDQYGAIGANGAQHTPEARPGKLRDVGEPGYVFEEGQLYNLNADDHIDDHGDVTGQEVAYAMLSAVAAT